ncbi:MAG: PIG-L family deacetylase [Candidatus Omnitrophota bacterium]|nr:MAG: PIG-L family deacetylase [Candidatus Omnitrophota bacterium]
MKKRFLFVSPHPDDVELGVGGTVIKLKQAGHKVFIVDCTWGEPTPFGTKEKRKRETQRATKILGVDKRANLELENRYLFDTKTARLRLAEQIRMLRPDIIFCPYPLDAHPDHLATTQITEAARFYAKYTKANLKGKPHYAFYLFYFFCTHLRIVPRVSFIVDISQQFKEKMRAIKCYRSQFIDYPKNKFIFDYIETQSAYFGKLIHTRHAEALYCKEAIKIKDFVSLL